MQTGSFLLTDAIVSNRGTETTAGANNGPVQLLGPDMSGDNVGLFIKWLISSADASGSILYILLRWNSVNDAFHGIEVYQGTIRGSLLVNDGANTSPSEVAASRSFNTVYCTRIIASGQKYKWRTWAESVVEPNSWDQVFTSVVGGLGRGVGIRFSQAPSSGAQIQIPYFSAATLVPRGRGHVPS